MYGGAEGLRDSLGVEVVEVTAASRLDKCGVRRTLLLSEDMALRVALRPFSPRPCLEDKQNGFFKSQPDGDIVQDALLFLW